AVAGLKWKGAHIGVDLNADRDAMQYWATLYPISFQFANPESGKGYAGKIKDITMSGASHKAEHDFWLGPQRSKDEGRYVKRNGKATVERAPGHVAGVKKETGNGKASGASGHGDLTCGTIRGWAFSGRTVEYALSGIKAKALRTLIDNFHD